MKSSSSSNNHTIAVAVGLAVGIPVFLTLVLLAWVINRHRNKLREEDQQHEKIDFNGDLSFDAYGNEQFRSADASASSMAADPRVMLDKSGSHSAVYSIENGSSTFLYTPNMEASGSRDAFTRQVSSVYGPSPAYPSSERLRAPPTMSKTTSLNGPVAGPYRSSSPANTGYFTPPPLVDPSPFATPPQRKQSSVTVLPASQEHCEAAQIHQGASESPSYGNDHSERATTRTDFQALGPTATADSEIGSRTVHPYAELSIQDREDLLALPRSHMSGNSLPPVGNAAPRSDTQDDNRNRLTFDFNDDES